MNMKTRAMNWIQRRWWTLLAVPFGAAALMFVASSSPSFLGTMTLGPQNSAVEIATAYFDSGALIPADATTTVWTLLPPLAVNESVDISTKTFLVGNTTSGTPSSRTARVRLAMFGTLNPFDGGYQFQDPSGSATPQTITSQIGSNVSGTTITLTTCGGFDGGSGYTLCLNELSPIAAESTFGGSLTRDLYPFDASSTAPILTSANPLIVVNGDTITLHGSGFSSGTPTMTIGASTGNAMTVSSDTLATATVPSGTSVGSGSPISVSVVGPGGSSGSVSVYSPVTAAQCPYNHIASTDTEHLTSGNIDTWFGNTFASALNATQATAGNRPTPATGAFSVASTPSVHFTVGKSLSDTMPTIATGYEIIAMVNIVSVASTGLFLEDNVSAAQFVWTFPDSTFNRIEFRTPSVASFAPFTAGTHMVDCIGGASSNCYVDNVVGTGGNSGTAALTSGLLYQDTASTLDVFAVMVCLSDIGTGNRNATHIVAQTLIGSP
jgi:hypothetical protein